jgi:hypothetical protein
VSTAARVDDSAHRVLVYGVQAQLIEAAGGFLSEALGAGGAAVAIASEEHLRALESWLALCTPEAWAAIAERRYRALPLDTLLAEIDHDGNAGALFEARMQQVLDQIPPELAPVHVFGEVAAGLWERRRVEDALRVEATSDRLRASRPMSLLCAYPERILDGAADVEQACRHHGEVVDAPSFPSSTQEDATLLSSAVLPPTPAACRTARRLVRAAFAPDGDSRAIGAAELVVGELAANAVRHAGSTFTAEVLLTDAAVRLVVTDAVPLPSGWNGFPIVREHGLGVVSVLASDWAVEPLAGGKLVWADVMREEV